MTISSEALNKFERVHASRIGEKHNKLTIISYAGRAKGYTCSCECGGSITAKYYRIRSGVTKSCRECFVSTASGRPVLPDSLGAKRNVRTQYRLSAKHRSLEFSLPDDEVFALITSDCAYCGLPPSTKLHQVTTKAHVDFRYNGIDRVDNSKGYVSGNCVPCCSMCNKAKLDSKLDEWLDWVNRVYSFQKAKGTFND